jgi:hypothetical protein
VQQLELTVLNQLHNQIQSIWNMVSDLVIICFVVICCWNIFFDGNSSDIFTVIKADPKDECESIKFKIASTPAM